MPTPKEIKVKTVRVLPEQQFNSLVEDRKALMDLRNQPLQKEIERLKRVQQLEETMTNPCFDSQCLL